MTVTSFSNPLPSPSGNPDRKKSLCDSIAREVLRELREDFGIDSLFEAQAIAEAWVDDQNDAGWRFDILREQLPALPKDARLLDLASGFGTAVLGGRLRGYRAFGIEPNQAKLNVCRKKVKVMEYPSPWISAFAAAYGEELPYRDGVFNAVLSYQTLEHVRNPKLVLSEMLRVTQSGGGIHLRCPSYAGTFEGHYSLPWLPCFPRAFAKIWLRWNHRPTLGLQGIVYVTQRQVQVWLGEIAKEKNITLTVIDLERARFVKHLKNRGVGILENLYPVYRSIRWLRDLFRRESICHLWIEVS